MRGPLIELVQSPATLIEISDDDNPGSHQIYLDGRAHPKEPDPLWYGDSIGHWEGDTLIVDRVNFTDEVWLDQQAHPHTDKRHVDRNYFDECAPATSTGTGRYRSGRMRLRSSTFGMSLMAI
jgi:hypothetical protein